MWRVFCRAGTGPLPPKPWSGRGRPPKLMRRNRQHQPAAVKALAIGLPAKAWRTITWRQGTKADLALCTRAGPCRAS
ncbi:transposase [Bradyrhizobium sp. Leo170]|uniref:transposase n=1 Tax=Bradyrhizobium sp. Leo170 TaxID=1571199 RepID=UPI001FE12D28|nr:transposase [Bradyrhizobium sp. Leo170]